MNIKEQIKQNKKILIETKNKLIVARDKGVTGCVKMVKRNIVNNSVLTLYGDRWLPEDSVVSTL